METLIEVPDVQLFAFESSIDQWVLQCCGYLRLVQFVEESPRRCLVDMVCTSDRLGERGDVVEWWFGKSDGYQLDEFQDSSKILVWNGVEQFSGPEAGGRLEQYCARFESERDWASFKQRLKQCIADMNDKAGGGDELEDGDTQMLEPELSYSEERDADENHEMGGVAGDII